MEAPESGTSDYERFIDAGLAAYDSGRFAEARSQFRRAHELAPSARTLRSIGMCAFNLGDYVDALHSLEAALLNAQRPLTDEQRAQVEQLIARSQAHVGRFKLRLEPQAAQLSVDGHAALRLASGELLLEPGRHELRVEAEGHRTEQASVEVEPGDRSGLQFRLEPLGAARLQAAAQTGAASPSDGPSSATAVTARTQPDIQGVLGYVALGLAGASAIGFGISTALAASEQGELDEHCPDRACPPAYHGDVDGYNRLKVISTVSLIGAASFGALGAALLLIGRDSPTERAALRPVIGVGAIGVVGRL